MSLGEQLFSFQTLSEKCIEEICMFRYWKPGSIVMGRWWKGGAWERAPLSPVWSTNSVIFLRRGSKPKLDGLVITVAHRAMAICIPFLELPHTEWLKTTELYSLTVLELRSLKSRCQWGRCFWSSRREPVLCLPPSFWRQPATLGVPWLVDTLLRSLSLSSHFLLPSPLRTLVIGFRTHPNPQWPPLEFFNLITSAKTFFPSKFRFKDSM